MGLINFHDTNFWIGENNLSKNHSVDETNLLNILIQRKKEYGITGTAVTHFNSFFYYPSSGNDLLAEFIQEINAGSESSLYICGAMLLEQEYLSNPFEFEKKLLNRIREGFKLLRLFPKSHKYPYDMRLLKGIYEILDNYSFPVMISLEEIDITGDKYIEWGNVLEIANKYENIPLIIDGGNSKELMFNSYIFLLLKNSTNIYLNTHNLFGINQIEDLVDIAGSERLIFDSYFPFYEAAISIERIKKASLPDEDKQNIAMNNIERLFRNIRVE
jgi:hypothetical protein